MSPVATLYISYDGVLEPLGESQVVTYLERLASEFSITLLSFEKAADLKDIARVSAMQDRLGRRGISWIRLRYHRRPAVVSTLWDVLSGIVHARRCCRLSGVEVIHAAPDHRRRTRAQAHMTLRPRRKLR